MRVSWAAVRLRHGDGLARLGHKGGERGALAWLGQGCRDRPRESGKGWAGGEDLARGGRKREV